MRRPQNSPSAAWTRTCAGRWPGKNWKPSADRQTTMLNADFIDSLRVRLEAHPIYAAVQMLDDLRAFMQHHVYSVWDFMSLIKKLQYQVAPARWPWTPSGDASVQRFINERGRGGGAGGARPGRGGGAGRGGL